MISRKHRFVFIHVPKTGGSSISQALSDVLGIENAKGVGIHYDDPGDIGEDYFRFAFHRNPWERFVSLYAYWMFHHAISNRLRNTFPDDFRFFCHNTDAIFDTIDPAERVHLLPQTALNGRNVEVDYWGRFSQLQLDFDFVCEKLGITRIPLGHHRRSHHGPYTDYYNRETRAIVAQRYRSDIEAFGYRFD